MSTSFSYISITSLTLLYLLKYPSKKPLLSARSTIERGNPPVFGSEVSWFGGMMFEKKSWISLELI